ncbi:hypothetical protein BJ741DRAFT_328905 [Chytriomyces cf. hyalinus JEL632]|nr:hypothetical protein BJ741DRAFT_328905 [Chytriomyces cf. hyalinus JEL632]
MVPKTRNWISGIFKERGFSSLLFRFENKDESIPGQNLGIMSNQTREGNVAGTTLNISNTSRNDEVSESPTSPDSISLSAFHGGGIGSLRMSSMMDAKEDAPLRQGPSAVPIQQANNMKGLDARGGAKFGGPGATAASSNEYAKNASVRAEDVRGSRSGSLHLSQTLTDGQQTNASQNGEVHGDQAGSLSMSDKLSNFRHQNSGISDNAGANKASNAPDKVSDVNNDFADIQTTLGTSRVISNKLSDAPKQANNDFVGIHATQGGGAVAMSAKLANANKGAPSTNNDFSDSLTNQVGSVSISEKIASSTKRQGGQVVNNDFINMKESQGPSLSMSNKMSAQQPQTDIPEPPKPFESPASQHSFSDSDTMEDVLKVLASNYGWDAAELAEDVASFKRNRVKNVKQARDLSDHAWNEMSDVLLTTKDLVRTAIGWVQH